MNVAVDTTSFQERYDNGKEQVLMNLLKGFQSVGVGANISVICCENRLDIYQELIHEAQFFVVKNKLSLSEDKNKFSSKVVRKIEREINNFFYISDLKKILAENPLDIIFFTNKSTPTVDFNIPSIVIPHDIQPISHPERFSTFSNIGSRIRKDFELRDAVISISDYDRDEMLKFFPQYAHKIHKIYNPIICRQDINKGKRKGIVCINVNYPHKNFITTLKAYNKIKDIINEPLIVTSFFDNAECLQYIKEQQLEPYIKFTGYLEEEELRDIVGSARLYVSSSLFEGFGMTPVEAIIQGVPCVIYKGTAAYESSQGLATYFENGTDEDELAAKILEELQKPLDFDELEYKSKALREIFDYKNIAQQYWNLMTELAMQRK